MLKGKVKWFSSEKGFGFLVIEGKDYFCHYSEIKAPQGQYRTLRENQIVFCESIGQSEKGEYAIGITPAVPEPIKETQYKEEE